MGLLKPFPEIGSARGNWNEESAERTHWIKVAARHLKRFKKWYENGPFSHYHQLGAAQVYAASHGLANRAQLVNSLAQMYEQNILGEFNRYIPPLSLNKRVYFFPQWRKATPRQNVKVALVAR